MSSQKPPSNKRRKRDLKPFADALVDAMRIKGMTQTALVAELTGIDAKVTQSMVSTWVNAVYAPNPYVLADVEIILGVNPGELSRHLGFLPLTFAEGKVSTVRDAIAADRVLDSVGKQALLAMYVHFAEGTWAPETPARRSPAKKATTRKPAVRRQKK